jgi:XTP/dITP diphosphohydrolase
MEILLATGNSHKREEFERIFSEHRILLPRELGLEYEYSETGQSFLENALGKARTLFDLSHRPVLADDSGLSVRSLGGEPGIYSARYGPEGQRDTFTDRDRYLYLLERMSDVTEREAAFVCCMVLIVERQRLFVAQETFEGLIAKSPAGQGGFGYDPVFFVPDRGCTVAQLPDEVKDRISHRGRAARRLLTVLSSL